MMNAYPGKEKIYIRTVISCIIGSNSPPLPVFTLWHMALQFLTWKEQNIFPTFSTLWHFVANGTRWKR